MKRSFDAVPRGTFDAARIDGCGPMRLFVSPGGLCRCGSTLTRCGPVHDAGLHDREVGLLNRDLTHRRAEGSVSGYETHAAILVTRATRDETDADTLGTTNNPVLSGHAGECARQPDRYDPGERA